MSKVTYTGPGRLSNPDLKLFQEPRAHPKIVKTLREFGLDGSKPNPIANMSLEELSSDQFMAKSHAMASKLYEVLPNDLPDDDLEPAIEQTERTFKSFDGEERKLHIFRGRDSKGKQVPAVLYIHGGGMVTLDTANKVHMRWCKSIAVHDVVSIAVDFRNAWTAKGRNPFPAGLNDCAAATQYVYQHRAELGISKVVLQGESGGGNLSLATALKAKKEGWLEQIAGVFANVPYISNAYGWNDERKIKELPSLYECDGYWMHNSSMAGSALYYTADEGMNPLAWPYHASVQDCIGLPPHIISVDELDPLRDEGMAYYRKLVSAGVQVSAQVNLGCVHATALIFRQLLPEVHNKAVSEIAAFALSVPTPSARSRTGHAANL